MRTHTLLAAPLLLLLLPAAAFPQARALAPIDIARRTALVIGNKTYPGSAELKNPINDARAVAAKLRTLGFAVTTVENVTLRELGQAVDAFTTAARERDLAWVYFAGHGVQVQGENYLVPIDFHAASEADVPYVAYPASRLRAKLELSGARVRVLVFDACRNNPYAFKRSLPGNGLAPMASNAEGTLIGFAANDGQTADDNGAAANGLYTTELLAALEVPGLPLREVFERVKAEVYNKSGRRQLPAVYDSVVGQLVLRVGAAVIQTPQLDDEAVYWRACEAQKGEACRIYAEQYPNGRFIRLARLYVSPASTTTNPTSGTPGGIRPDSHRNTKDGLIYIHIPLPPPAGFQMGCVRGDGECREYEPSVRVQLTRPYAIGQTEVPQSAYERLMRTNPSTFKGATTPVQNVSQEHATAYCAAIGGRLPTEAEWEWAAQGGLTSASRYGPVGEIGWYKSNSDEKPHPVASKLPNAYGLYDMLGNVGEWTATWFAPETSGGRDPQGPSTGNNYKVVRGGSWYYAQDYLRFSNRDRDIYNSVLYDIGFRCAIDLPR